MAALFDRLSPESRHRRFLSPKRELTPRELTYFTDIDHLNHEAIAAVDLRDGSIVGVARYVRYADRAGVAEVAIEVADAFQQIGIGTALADLTIQRAHANGLTLLTATTLWENHAARRLLRHHGFRARRSRGHEIEHELKLEESSRELRASRDLPNEGHDMIDAALNMALAHARAADLRRAAEAHRLARDGAQPRRPVAADRSVTLRFGSPADHGPLARLAELDSTTSPAQPVLLAEVDGRLRAALALKGGAVVADPFYPTADLIDLLRARARQLSASPRIRHSRRLRSWFRRQALAWR